MDSTVRVLGAVLAVAALAMAGGVAVTLADGPDAVTPTWAGRVSGQAPADGEPPTAVPREASDATQAEQEAPTADPPGADEAVVAEGPAGDTEPVGMLRPAFPPAEGRTPTQDDIASLVRVRDMILRHDDAPAQLGLPGTGTLEDPYVITGFYVTHDLKLRNTDACYVIKENYVDGQLTLNWNGQCVHVHHNHIADLRVNENRARTGYATGGLLESNVIEYIGQLRHYDGELRNNIIGPVLPGSVHDEVLETVPWTGENDPRVANVDGFNQGLIHHNTFYGSVDLDLHGHHHGTGFFAPTSHYHGDDNVRHEHAIDHTQRWTSVSFTDNRIVDHQGFGLRYEDRAHAGDDRLANSEQEDDLARPHLHFTHIVMSRNVVEGGRIKVDVFNADDDNHYTRNPGWLEIEDNTVHYNERGARNVAGMYLGAGASWDAGIYIEKVKEVELRLARNTVVLVPHEGDDDTIASFNPLRDPEPEPMGILIEGVRDASLLIEGNSIFGYHYGVYAIYVDEQTTWGLEGNDFSRTQQPIWYDETVRSPPE